MKGPLTRRVFAGAGIVAIAAGARVIAGRLVRRQGGADLVAELTGMPLDDGRLRALGRAFLTAHPDDAGAAELARRLETEIAAGADPVPGLLAAIHDDYESARAVTLDGWVVSLTEARLFALAAAEG